MKKIVLCPNGSYKLPNSVVEYLKNNGHPEANPLSFCDDRTNPVLISALEAVQNVPADVIDVAKRLDSALTAFCVKHDAVINEWEDIEYLIFFYVRNLCYKRADGLRQDCPKDDMRKNRLLLGHMRRHSDWQTFLSAISAEFEQPYESDAMEDMQCLYELVCSYIDYSQDLLRAWNVTYIARAFKEYINNHCVSWEKFSYLLYQFTVYYPFGSDVKELSSRYSEYLLFMEKNGDIIRDYLSAVDAHYRHLSNNSIELRTSSDGCEFAFVSPLVIEEYDNNRFIASVERKEVNIDAFDRKVNCQEYLRLTPCLTRSYIESFVLCGDCDGLWKYLESLKIEGVQYRD